MDLFPDIIIKPASFHIWFSDLSHKLPDLLRNIVDSAHECFYLEKFHIILINAVFQWIFWKLSKCKCFLVGHSLNSSNCFKNHTQSKNKTYYISRRPGFLALLHHYLWKSNTLFKILLLNISLNIYIYWGNWMKWLLRFTLWPKGDSQWMFKWANQWIIFKALCLH